MNKKLLSFSVILAVLSCNNAHSMRRIQDPQIVRCSENERRSVRIIVADHAGSSSGTVLQNTAWNPRVKPIISCVHSFSDVMFDMFDEDDQFAVHHTSDSGFYRLPTSTGLSATYDRYAFEYMSDVVHSKERGGYIVDRYYNRTEKFLISDIRDSMPRNVFTRLGYMQLCPNCLAPRTQQLSDFHEDVEPDRIHPLWQIQNTMYTIRTPKVYMPFDISISFAEKAGPINIIESVLPTAEEINSWRGRDLQVTIHGFPSFDLRHEYKFTIPCRLTDNGRWMHSLDSYTVGFAQNTLGMSGGPCFIDGKLCGVLSGAKIELRTNLQQLYIKTIPTELTEVINSFGD